MRGAKIVKAVFLGSVKDRVDLYLRAMVSARESGFHRMAKLISYRLQRYGVHIASGAIVHRSLDLRHPVGVVIGEGVKVGVGVKIYQNVTLGGARVGDFKDNNYPEIGEQSVIFAGAAVLGKVRIGKCCVIGANAVVTRDVPDFTTVVGIPAKPIRKQVIVDTYKSESPP